MPDYIIDGNVYEAQTSEEAIDAHSFVSKAGISIPGLILKLGDNFVFSESLKFAAVADCVVKLKSISKTISRLLKCSAGDQNSINVIQKFEGNLEHGMMHTYLNLMKDIGCIDHSERYKIFKELVAFDCVPESGQWEVVFRQFNDFKKKVPNLNVNQYRKGFESIVKRVVNQGLTTNAILNGRHYQSSQWWVDYARSKNRA